ncbi:enolase C-terminal domain-like protein [Blattabacterium cuenoti]|uniref:enolase C-terminal domain-like protein n=1 Tax=Blattabacterium cuenoti TaxID=1653831 RepID=UPI001EEC278C|nr:enolase C-terminal domain-like protein [Blattabacterium cuenoti]
MEKNNKVGIGECNPILDKFILNNLDKFKMELKDCLKKVISLKKTKICYYNKYISYSSIFFGLEQAFLGLKNKFHILYDSEFTHGKKGIFINDLIWLDFFKNKKKNNIIKKIEEKFFEGYSFIKMKISSNLFDYQYLILKNIQKKYPFVRIRIDANGCFKNTKKALYCLNKLYDLNIIDSVEQPIPSGNWKEMSRICKESKIPIALDEELYGINKLKDKKKLLNIIYPKYIVLKPSLNRGFSGSREWILEANKRKIKWWVSSSLESNIGLNAITQWTFMMEQKYGCKNEIVHGLNTGDLYINNWNSPLKVKKGSVWYDPYFISNIKIF